MKFKPDSSRCPTNGTWDTTDANSVPFVPCPTNETPCFFSVLDIAVSCFASYNSPDNPKSVNLLTWLTSAKYSKKVEAIRTTSDKKERHQIKATLPAITPSGLFTRRAASALIQHSGIICLDIDLKGNEGISNYANLKQEICKIKNVAYCGHSVSGTGYFVLIPIAYPEQHGSQFKALRDIFQKKYGVRIDNTPDVSRLRGYSYDPEGYFNHQATPFRVVYSPPAPSTVKNEKTVPWFITGDFADIVLQRCVRLIEESHDGEKHTKLNLAAYTVGGYVAGGVLDEGRAITALEEAIGRKPNVADIRAASRTIREAVQQGKQQPIFDEVQESKNKKAPVPNVGRGTMGHFWASGTDSDPTTIESNEDEETVPHLGRGTVEDEKTGSAVTTIAGQIARPGSRLRPNESQLVRLPVEPCDSYPLEWDTPNEPDANPVIKPITFFEWQRQDPAFSQLGLASLASHPKRA